MYDNGKIVLRGLLVLITLATLGAIINVACVGISASPEELHDIEPQVTDEQIEDLMRVAKGSSPFFKPSAEIKK